MSRRLPEYHQGRRRIGRQGGTVAADLHGGVRGRHGHGLRLTFSCRTTADRNAGGGRQKGGGGKQSRGKREGHDGRAGQEARLRLDWERRRLSIGMVSAVVVH